MQSTPENTLLLVMNQFLGVQWSQDAVKVRVVSVCREILLVAILFLANLLLYNHQVVCISINGMAYYLFPLKCLNSRAIEFLNFSLFSLRFIHSALLQHPLNSLLHFLMCSMPSKQNLLKSVYLFTHPHKHISSEHLSPFPSPTILLSSAPTPPAFQLTQILLFLLLALLPIYFWVCSKNRFSLLPSRQQTSVFDSSTYRLVLYVPVQALTVLYVPHLVDPNIWYLLVANLLFSCLEYQRYIQFLNAI